MIVGGQGGGREREESEKRRETETDRNRKGERWGGGAAQNGARDAKLSWTQGRVSAFRQKKLLRTCTDTGYKTFVPYLRNFLDFILCKENCVI
jgi:hypothetical protein